MVKETHYYDLLGIQTNANTSEIKKAFREKARKFHPDKKGGNEETFKKINEAYETLIDNNKRQVYDKFGKDGKPEGIDLSDMFRGFGNLFGGHFGRQKPQPKKTPTMVYTYEVTLEDLCRRKLIKLKLTRDRECKCIQNMPNCNKCDGSGNITQFRQLGIGMIQQIQIQCPICHGNGKIYNGCDNCNKGIYKEKKVFEIQLDPEFPNNHVISYIGDGNQQIGFLTGDFEILIKRKKHQFYDINNFNLILHRNISLKQALNGFKETIIHPKNEKIVIDTTGQVINPNKDFILKGQGLTSKHNLIIKFVVNYPTKLSQKQFDVIEENF